MLLIKVVNTHIGIFINIFCTKLIDEIVSIIEIV